MSLLEAVKKLKDSITGGAGTVQIVDDFKSILDIVFGTQGFAASGTEAGVQAEMKATVAACQSRLDSTGVQGGPVGKLGDGVLLKIIIDALIKFAPLFI